MSNYLSPINELEYDPNDVRSVIDYAQKLLSGSLRPYLSATQLAASSSGKGDFGNLLEEAYFKVKNNNESRPDIYESGIEIKSGQLVADKNLKDSLKERLKISMIDYMSGFDSKNLLESHLWTKLEKILLMLFRRNQSLRIDQECVYADLLTWTSDDVKQMSEDWLSIKQMVLSGKANDLSEGNTWYLGACTAGASSLSLRNAPGDIRVKVRAFSLKRPYLNYKLGYGVKVNAPKILLVPEVGETLDTFILKNMKPFFGKSVGQVATLLHRPKLSESFAKNMKSLLARAILEEISNKHTDNISTDFEQFRKAGVIEKAVTLETSGTLKESISFPAFKWKELDEEDEWENSVLYSILTTKFFFTVFQKVKSGEPILLGCFFWTMPSKNLEAMKDLWIDTKLKISNNDYDNFLGQAQHEVGHVRPHAANALDKFPTPQGGNQTKKSFWLNSSYIKNIVAAELKL